MDSFVFIDIESTLTINKPVNCLRICPISFELILELRAVIFGVDVRMFGCLRNFVSLNSLVKSDQKSLPRSLGGAPWRRTSSRS